MNSLKLNLKMKNKSSLINSEQYNSKLSKLLDKIQIQNRYSNRISTLNERNMDKLERASQQLHEIKEIRKIEEINEVILKNMNSELSKNISQLTSKLDETVLNVVQAERQIKRLKQIIKKLEQEILFLQQQSFHTHRKKLHEIISVKEQLHQHRLETSVKDFIAKVQWKDTILINQCREAVQNGCFDSFFFKLHQKLEEDKKKTKTVSSTICPKLSQISRDLKSKNQVFGKIRNSFSEKKRNFDIEVKDLTHRRMKTLIPLSPNFIS